MITIDQLLEQYPETQPISGVCFVELDPLPEKIGSLFIPEVARDMKVTEPLCSGTVLKMSPRKLNPNTGLPYSYDFQEQFQAGDRVILTLRMEDLNKRVVATHNTRVYAVLATTR